MILHGLLLCVHMAFTIDRIEDTSAIVEWMGTTETSDIASDLFPYTPKEGERWLIHLKPAIQHHAQGPALTPEQSANDVELSVSLPNLKPYPIRMTRITNQETLEEFKL